MTAKAPQVQTVLETLSKARLAELARSLGVALPRQATREAQVAELGSSDQIRLRSVVEWMGRDELRRACEALAIFLPSIALALLATGRAPERTRQDSRVRHRSDRRECAEASQRRDARERRIPRSLRKPALQPFARNCRLAHGRAAGSSQGHPLRTRSQSIATRCVTPRAVAPSGTRFDDPEHVTR